MLIHSQFPLLLDTWRDDICHFLAAIWGRAMSYGQTVSDPFISLLSQDLPLLLFLSHINQEGCVLPTVQLQVTVPP